MCVQYIKEPLYLTHSSWLLKKSERNVYAQKYVRGHISLAEFYFMSIGYQSNTKLLVRNSRACMDEQYIGKTQRHLSLVTLRA